MKIGLTGNIGSGKSLALTYFAEAGAAVIDCDDIVAEMYSKPHAFHACLRVLLGNEVMGEDKLPIKAKVAEAIFSHPEMRAQLGEVMRPHIHAGVIKFFEENEKTHTVQVVAVPLLFEAHWQEFFDANICVWAGEDLRLHRLMEFRNFSTEEALARNQAQMNESKKLALSDFALINDGTNEWLQQQALALMEKFCLRAQKLE